MKRLIVLLAGIMLFVQPHRASLQKKQKFSAPRFPSYLKTPKNVDEVVPYARAAVRQIGGRSPLGLVEKGQSVLLVAADHLGEQLVLEAIKRAYAEEGIQACILYESEIVGISRDDALKIHGAKGLIPPKSLALVISKPSNPATGRLTGLKNSYPMSRQNFFLCLLRIPPTRRLSCKG